MDGQNTYFYPEGWVIEIEITSEIKQCTYEGIDCLYKYIDTRIDQPSICANCLRDLHLIDNYKTKYKDKNMKKKTMSEAMKGVAMKEMSPKLMPKKEIVKGKKK